MTLGSSDLQIRCTCRAAPLLALAGRDKMTGLPFVWMKVHRQHRIDGEMIATEGTVHLRCRKCLRWMKVLIERVPGESLQVQPSNLSAQVTTDSL